MNATNPAPESVSHLAPPTAPEQPVDVHRPALSELAPTAAGVSAGQAESNLRRILDIPVDIEVQIGSTELPIGDVLRLAPGSVIELDRPAGSAADLIVNGKLIGQGEVVVVGERFGVRITRLVEPEERIESL